MDKKYELTDETKEFNGITLRRIRASTSFPGVPAGELGGWIEKEENLSQDGNAWVYDGAWVCGDAMVCGNAMVSGDAMVSGNAKVSGYAMVYGDARVSGNAQVYDNARVSGNARVYGDAKVSGNAMVYGNAEVCGDAKVCGYADYVVFKNCWSSFRWFTYTHSNKMWKVGCFHGTGEELIRKAYADSEISGRCYEAIVKAVETIEKAKGETK